MAVDRHKKEHLPQTLAESGALAPVTVEGETQGANPDRNPTAAYALEKRKTRLAHAIDLAADFGEQHHRLKKFSDAIDAWLTDPDDPERYDIGPRASEVMVVYDDLSDCSAKGAPRRKRARLSHLLAHVAEQSGGSIRPVSGEASFADPREGLGKNARDMLAYMSAYTDMLTAQYNAREIQIFQDAVVDTLNELDQETISRFHASVHRRIAEYQAKR
jgi:hypothetical protein